MWFAKRRQKLNLALQGGGAHGAFTWGVLDRLLEEDSLDLGWVSATSAGAVNAVALAAGLAEGGRPAAQAKLRDVWDAVVQAGMPEFIRLNPFLNGLSRSPSLARVASLWSPYDLNPLGFDPLRQLLIKHIDFEKLRASPSIELLIAATAVTTGAPRLFRRHEITVDTVLASACLPSMHHAVEIDGVAYWDGGFSANPDIVNLVLESPVQDTLIVQLNPLTRAGLPTTMPDITEHAYRLTFNAPLLRDVHVIETAREAVCGAWPKRKGRLRHLARHRFHLIEAGAYTALLGSDSKIKPDANIFSYLHSAGRSEAGQWLEQHKADIGRRETVDLTAKYLRPAAQPEPVARPEPEPIVAEQVATPQQVSGG